MDNVAKAVADGSRGKSPPVLAAKFPLFSGGKVSSASEVFPFQFTLTSDNLTAEGAYGATTEAGVLEDEAVFWWAKDDLIVSARLDSDGVAATRDPEDLVGRGLYRKENGGVSDVVQVELQGRGIGGKFVTKKGK